MVVKAQVRVRHHGCLMTSLRPGTMAMQVSADEDADLVLVQGDPAEVERFVRHIEADKYEPFQVLGRTPTSALVRTRNPPVGVIATIVDSGCTILWPAVYRDGVETYDVVAPSAARLRALERKLTEFGPVEVGPPSEVGTAALAASAPLADLAAGFTPRQLEAVLVAVEAGYYDVPRRVEAKALALRLGLARSTFEEHLRKGEALALRRFAGLVRAHPGLDAGATRGRGRPKGTPGVRRQLP